MKRAVLTLLVVGVSVAVPATATARQSHETELTVHTVDNTDTHLLFAGSVDAVKKCRSERKLQLVLKLEDDPATVMDRDVSSTEGAFAFQVENGLYLGTFKVRAPKKKVGNDVCKPKTVSVVF